MGKPRTRWFWPLVIALLALDTVLALGIALGPGLASAAANAGEGPLEEVSAKGHLASPRPVGEPAKAERRPLRLAYEIARETAPAPEREEVSDELEWLEPLMRCGRHGGRRFCNGPRRAPKPHGPAAARAERLDLGTHATGAKLLRSAPYRRWRDALAKLDLSAPEELLWPVRDGPFGRGFGRQQGKMHEGIDVGAERGEPVLAVADGLVAYADNSIRGYGNLLIVLHGGTSVGAYAHLSEIRVFPGQLIERGQVVGEVGNTGISRGDHLHFELHERGEPVDPAYRFER